MYSASLQPPVQQMLQPVQVQMLHAGTFQAQMSPEIQPQPMEMMSPQPLQMLSEVATATQPGTSAGDVVILTLSPEDLNAVISANADNLPK